VVDDAAAWDQVESELHGLEEARFNELLDAAIAEYSNDAAAMRARIGEIWVQVKREFARAKRQRYMQLIEAAAQRMRDERQGQDEAYWQRLADEGQRAHEDRQGQVHERRPSAEELERQAWADKISSGLRNIVVEDIARELSLDYRKAVDVQRALAEEVRKAGYAFDRAGRDADQARYRIEERRQKLNGVRRWLHDRRWLPDQELANWEGSLRGAEYDREKQNIYLKTVQDRLASAELAAGEALRKVRLDAERELQERHQIAEQAREQLAESRTVERME
jgi:hypothetical protein